MKFIQPFKGMPHPIVCPKFLKLQGFYGCLGKCEYCYLRATYIRQCGGEVPRPTLYENTGPDMLLKEFQRFCKKETTPQLLNAGELADSFAMEDGWYPGAGPFSQFIIEMFRRQNTHKILFLTKISIIQNVLKLQPTDQAIFSFSFNPRTVIERCSEPNNLAWRISSSRSLQQTGWHVRGRIDPILPDMIDDYESLIPCLLHLERITLGSLRINNRQLPQTRPSFWESILPSMVKVNASCMRFPVKQDVEAFSKIIGWLKALGYKGEIALCKEHFEVWKKLGLDYATPKCNCVI